MFLNLFTYSAFYLKKCLDNSLITLWDTVPPEKGLFLWWNVMTNHFGHFKNSFQGGPGRRKIALWSCSAECRLTTHDSGAIRSGCLVLLNPLVSVITLYDVHTMTFTKNISSLLSDVWMCIDRTVEETPEFPWEMAWGAGTRAERGQQKMKQEGQRLVPQGRPHRAFSRGRRQSASHHRTAPPARTYMGKRLVLSKFIQN